MRMYGLVIFASLVGTAFAQEGNGPVTANQEETETEELSERESSQLEIAFLRVQTTLTQIRALRAELTILQEQVPTLRSEARKVLSSACKEKGFELAGCQPSADYATLTGVPKKVVEEEPNEETVP